MINVGISNRHFINTTLGKNYGSNFAYKTENFEVDFYISLVVRLNTFNFQLEKPKLFILSSKIKNKNKIWQFCSRIESMSF